MHYFSLFKLLFCTTLAAVVILVSQSASSIIFLSFIFVHLSKGNTVLSNPSKPFFQSDRW